MEAEECYPPMVGTPHSLQINVAEVSQPREPYNIQIPGELDANLIHFWGTIAMELFNSLTNVNLSNKRAYPRVLWG